MDWFLYDRDLRHERVKDIFRTLSNIYGGDFVRKHLLAKTREPFPQKSVIVYTLPFISNAFFQLSFSVAYLLLELNFKCCLGDA